MAHLDLSHVKSEDDITEDLLANDEEHKKHNAARLNISKLRVEALKYEIGFYGGLAVNTLKKGEICSLDNLVRFNIAATELNAEMQYQQLLNMPLMDRLTEMRKLAAKVEASYSQSSQNKPNQTQEQPQYTKRQPKVTTSKVHDEGDSPSEGIIPITKKPIVKGKVVG
jgi:hypothetical protein